MMVPRKKAKFEDLSEDWTCALCGAPKQMLEEIIEEIPSEEKFSDENNPKDLRALSNND